MKIEGKQLELYFHIPFCVRKCNYCDFLSAPCTAEQQEAYMGALFAELEGRAGEYEEYTVTTIFIGGGTPSMLPGKMVRELLMRIREHYAVDREVEITIEVNPGTVDEEKLKSYYSAGVNRLSIGMQSAQEEELRRLGRIHTYEQFQETYQLARKSGFSNINVDVMSALPGQSLASYQDTLEKLLHLSPMPEHISAYSLIVEEGTPFAEWEAEGRLHLPDEDCEREMYEETKRILEKEGFERYEISNYARAGYECRHNCGYWTRKNYVGFGIGAASMVENERFQNESDLQEYLKNPLRCRSKKQRLTVSEQMEETMFLGLRMTKGISEAEFFECYGRTLETAYGDVIEQNVKMGLLQYREENGERYLRLTERGLDVSNYVMSQFLFDSH